MYCLFPYYDEHKIRDLIITPTASFLVNIFCFNCNKGIFFLVHRIIICNDRIKYNRGTNKFVRFFLEIWGFILKNRLHCNHSKYCPSLVTIFSHLSDNLRIPSRKNDVGFDAIHESTHFSVSS